MKSLQFGKITVNVGDYIKVQSGIRLYIGQITDITEFGEIVMIDVKGNTVILRRRSISVLTVITEEEFRQIQERYK